MSLVNGKFVRRNIIDLKENYPADFGRFILALKNLEDSEEWSRICGIHGNTFNMKDKGVLCPTNPEEVEKIGNTTDEPFYCAHSETKFIAWHTPYVYQFELLLNKYNNTWDKSYISLPYLWLRNNDDDYSFINRSTITVSVDGKNITIKNPLAAENVSYYDHNSVKKTVKRNGFLTPSTDVEKMKLDTTNKELNNVLYALRYQTFSSNTVFNEILEKLIEFNPLEIPHNNLHDYIGGEGGNMSDVPISAYDPLFWMHHCNMDRHFYNWMYIVTDKFSRQLSHFRIPQETLNGTLAPFFPNDNYENNCKEHVYGWMNDKNKYLKIGEMLEFDKYPYTYEEIEIQPYKRPYVTVEITGMPIPMETTHIEVILCPNDTELDDKTKTKYIAGSGTWFGVNRYLRHCKRCSTSRTNMKIDIEPYMIKHNISIDDLVNYKWWIEGKGRLHPDENDIFKKYTQEDIVKDGHINLVIH